IQATAYDSILDHSFSGNSLDWWRLNDTGLLEQSVSWSVIVSVPEPGSRSILGLIGLAMLSTRRRKQHTSAIA
ncbi:PEP-CTERM sorting domain-containing protein, partial [Mariniblastus sp.]|nr:PEP-CTERM sorting domain-containing protein [Mariniblastus sp.]